MAKRRTGYLGDLDICGVPFSVYEKTLEEDPRLDDCYGYTDCSGKIVLRKNMSSELFRHTLIHEMQHAIWEHSGIKSLMKGCVSGDASFFEETFIEMQTCHLIKALASLKRLKRKDDKNG